MKTILFVGAVTGSFAAGVFYGAKTHRKSVIAKMKEYKPILVNVLTDTIHRTQNENLTKEEIYKHLADDLDFIKIISQ